jgi:hypothetical protein
MQRASCLAASALVGTEMQLQLVGVLAHAVSGDI